MKMNTLLLLACFCGIGSFNCSHSKKMSPAEKDMNTTGNLENSNDQILFISLKLKKDNSSIIGQTVKLLEARRVNGVLKAPLKSSTELYPGDLILEFMDINQNVLTTLTNEDPLTSSVEYIDDDGSLKRKFVDKQEEDLTLRVQNNILFHQFRIKKVMLNGNIAVISTFKL